MNPLSLNRKILIWLCVCPRESEENSRQKIERYIFTCTVILASILTFTSSLAFFLKFVSTNLESALYASSVVIAILGALYINLIALFTRKKITLIFTNLSQLYDSSKDLFIFTSFHAKFPGSNWTFSYIFNESSQIKIRQHWIFWCKQTPNAIQYAICVYFIYYLCLMQAYLYRAQLHFYSATIGLEVSNAIFYIYLMLSCK